MTRIPGRMIAVLLKGHGGFEQLEYVEDVPVPDPGPGEVLVRVGAAAVNNTDINTRVGWYSRGVSEGTTATDGAAGLGHAEAEDASWLGTALVFPRIQGIDVCGRIVALGKGVDAHRLGERVLIEPCFRRPDGRAGLQAVFLGSECDGGFAQYVRAPAVHAYRIESPLSDAQLASFPCSYSTAENMLTRAQLESGETVLVTGASGGVGSAAVQLARRRGARVIAVAAAAKTEEVRQLGADEVVARDADPGDVVSEDAVDVVVDLVGGARWPRLLELLRRGGRYAVSGAIAGPIVELDLRVLYLKDLRLFGCTVLEPDVFGNLVGYIERGEIRPVVAKTYPLAEIVAAQKTFLEKRFTGKIVLLPPG
ncbi:MAG: alcohol dehydrogenase family protein [Rhodospirillales bacterium]|nr:MAG: alcohol dehydrogenase family protein [Rhodospirillales bacterium]